MLSITVLMLCIFMCSLSKLVFKKWFNHISLYTVIWSTMIILYDLDFVFFYPISNYTWIIIAVSYLSFIIGVFIVYTFENPNKYEETEINKAKNVKFLFGNDGRMLKNSIIIFSIIGLIGAIHHWMVLISMFGSIKEVLVNAYTIYNMRHTGEISGVVPYIWLFSYFSIFLSGIYLAYNQKFSFIVILPIVGVILKELARFSRHGILIGLFEFFVSYLLYQYLIKGLPGFKRESYKNNLISIIVVIALIIGAASFVKFLRQPTESYTGTSRQLSEYKGNVLISPQIYFYGASQIVVLSRFIEKDIEDEPIGGNTFFHVYNLFSHLGMGERLDSQHKGYYTPEWSNTATYLRDLYNDFGVAGILIGPFLLGFFATLYWFKFFRTGNIKYHLILSHIYLIICMSFFVLVTRMVVVVYGLMFQYFFAMFLIYINKRRQLLN